jgi:arginyl-tRNA synthetase
LVWTRLIEGLTEALRAEGLDTPENRARIELALPRERAHGDWTTNLALQVARAAKRPPRQLAEALVAAFPRDPQTFGAVEVAGPGFINFRYADGFLAALPSRITGAGEGFGHHPHAAGTPVLVEYVSANPTGPLNVVNARAAAVGAALVRLLAATGHRAAGEFYVNDAGHQVELLGASLAARFAERVAVPLEMPANGYMGDYLRDLAGELDPVAARAALDAGDAAWFRDQALERVLAWQRRDLDAYGAEFARWFRESALHADGSVAATRDALEARGVTYHARHPESGYEREEDAPSAGADAGEATWLRSSGFGDSQDRVLVRSNGAPTYLLPDTAYHRDKRARGFRHAIDLWGPDHHAYVRTLRASLLALGLEPDFLEVLIVQQVNLIRDGAVLDMSKRKGQLITLRELMDDVGADCAKFFFLMRTTNAHLDFDLDLARSQSDENPAYYVQYAHARIASIQRRAAARGIAPAEGPVRLEHPAEVALVRRLAEFPEVVRGAAFAREPHRLPAYLVETAAELHRFYHHCRVLGDDAARSAERLRVVEAARVVLRNGLALMGVSAPERLERAESEPEEEAAS